jgi:AraC family transcriptional activator FtrA
MPESRRDPKRARKQSRPHRVVALVYDRLALFELATAVEVFGLPRPELGIPWYDFALSSLDPGPVRATGPVRIAASRSLRSIEQADTMIVVRMARSGEVPPARLLAAVRPQRRGRASSDLLRRVRARGRRAARRQRATTRWRYTDELRRRYPRIRVEPDVLYVDEGACSRPRAAPRASTSACISCASIMAPRSPIRWRADWWCRRIATADRRVHRPPMPRRPSGASRARSTGPRPPRTPAHGRRSGAAVGDVTAHAAPLSRRDGRTRPWLNHQRVFAAQRRLESSRDSIEDVASAVGFGTAQTLRLHFRRVARTSPTAYRRRFSTRRVNR